MKNEFLFSPEIAAYVAEVRMRALEMRTLSRELARWQGGEAQDAFRRGITEKQLSLSTWFESQYNESRKLFGKYLSIHAP